MADTDTSPIFIAGSQRSGTTLLARIIGNNTSVQILPFDPWWWTVYYEAPAYGDFAANPRTLERLVFDMVPQKLRKRFDIRIDLDAIVNQLRSRQPNLQFGQVIDAIMSAYAGAHGKQRWAHKAPNSNELAADRIFAAFPSARMVHIVRDPRDVLVSIKSRDWQHSAIANALLWDQSTRHGLRNKRRYPERYLIFRYEDLVQQPGPTMEVVCRFLRLAYSGDLLRGFDDAAQGKPHTMFRDVKPNAISPEAIGRHRHLLGSTDRAVCQILTGRRAIRFGYSPVPAHAAAYAAAVGRITIELPAWRLRAWIIPFAARHGWHDRLSWIDRPTPERFRRSMELLNQLDPSLPLQRRLGRSPAEKRPARKTP